MGFIWLKKIVNKICYKTRVVCIICIGFCGVGHSLAQRVPHPPVSGSENAPPTCLLAQRVSHPPASLLRECPTHMFPGSESVPPTWLLAQRASHPPVSWLREFSAPTCFLAQGVPHPPVSWHRECPSHLFPGSESGLSTRC